MPKDRRSKPQKQPNAPAVPAAGAAAPPQTPTPAWPPFRPKLPASGGRLGLETVADGKVALLRNFWPRALCRDYVAFLATLPLTTTPGRPKRGDAVRVNDRFEVQDPAFADRLWRETGLAAALLDDPQIAALW
jgi:hypothetical protein